MGLKSNLPGVVTEIGDGTVDVAISNNITALAFEYISLAGTAEQVPAHVCQSCIIQADHDNAAPVYIGIDNSVVAADSGFRLDSGEHLPLAIDNTSRVWIIGTAAQKVRVLYVNKS